MLVMIEGLFVISVLIGVLYGLKRLMEYEVARTQEEKNEKRRG